MLMPMDITPYVDSLKRDLLAAAEGAGPEARQLAERLSYAIDPAASAGSVKVVSGSGAEGFSVTVGRTVYQHGKVLRRDWFRSTYIPEGPTTVYGPGGHPPGPYFVLPKV